MTARGLVATLATAVLVMTSTTHASGSGDCATVRFAEVGWTGVSAKTATAAWMLGELGYRTQRSEAKLPAIYESLTAGERDAFLGLWLPTERERVRPYLSHGDIDIVGKNLEGAKYTVAVSADAWQAGVRDFEDLAAKADRFGGRIFATQPDNKGTKIIDQMIADDAYGMSVFGLETGDVASMLAAVGERHDNGDWAAWLGWAPHPMTLDLDMRFLRGGADYWGPNQGGANVHTITRAGYAWNCPNVGQFLENYRFTVAEQSRLAGYVSNDGMNPAAAGRRLIEENPELLERWFGQGGTYRTGAVRSVDGERSAKAALSEALGL